MRFSNAASSSSGVKRLGMFRFSHWWLLFSGLAGPRSPVAAGALPDFEGHVNVSFGFQDVTPAFLAEVGTPAAPRLVSMLVELE
jgi:hypothetical protein